MSGCEEIRELLVAAARREPVSAAGERFLREHLDSCGECRRRSENERMLSAGLSELAVSTAEIPGPAVKAALLADFRRQQKITPIRRPAVKWAVVAAAAAAVLLAVWLTRPRQPEARIATVQPAVQAPARPETPAPPAVQKPTAPVKPVMVRHSRPRPKAAPRVVEEPAEIATDFFEIPYVDRLRPDERADVFRIEMPRAGMAVYGLPVTGGRLDARIKADVLLGEDGVARAIRFIR